MPWNLKTLPSDDRIILALADGQLLPIPIIKGGGNPAYEQFAFRYRNDDGAEDAASWLYATDADGDVGVDATVRVRFTIRETAGQKGLNQQFQLWYSFNTGTYAQVTTASSPLRATGSVNSTWTLTDEDATTQQISTGSFIAGAFNDDDQIGENNQIDFAASSRTELECCFMIIGSAVADGDSLDLRVRDEAGAEIASYRRVPHITITKAPTPITIGLTAAGMTGTAQALSPFTPPLIGLGLAGITGLPLALSVPGEVSEYYPNEDIVTGSWINEEHSHTGLYASIDETERDDADFVQSAFHPSSGQYRSGLESFPAPTELDGWYVAYTYGKNAALGDSINLKVVLEESGTELASWSHVGIATGLTFVEQSIPTGAIAAISNPDNVGLRFIADTTGTV